MIPGEFMSNDPTDNDDASYVRDLGLIRPATDGSEHDSAPGSICSRGRAVAGAQVASRRKAHHGSSRTVFHEGSDIEPGGH